MIRTGDSNAFKDVGGKAKSKAVIDDFEEERLAIPKGIQTRAAIANHLAKKLKISN